MTPKTITRTLLVLLILLYTGTGLAQSYRQASNPAPAKPYKILTSGKQITVKSSRDIKTVMVWTASGHRIVEQKEINSATFTFQVNISERYFFVMIQYEGEKPFTEKIGLQ